MAEHALMERAGEQMNVPAEKVEAFEKDGWKVIQKVYDTPTPENVQTPEGESTPEAVVEKVSKRKAKG
jgi:hypothetical protein